MEKIDPDAALTLLAEMSGATDERLRRLARDLAGRVMLRLASGTGPTRRGIGRLRTQRLEPGIDIDLEESLDALLPARAVRQPAAVEELKGRGWTKPGTAVCLVIDRSGSTGGRRLATAALAAAAVALRADDYSVLAFSSRVQTIKDQQLQKPAGEVVDAVLSLRGHGTTNIDAALHAALEQLSRSRASRKAVLLLSDGRSTTGPDPVAIARQLDSFLVLAPTDGEETGEEAKKLALAAGGKFAAVTSPRLIPAAIAALWPS